MLIIVPSRGRPHKIAEPHEAWARRAPAPSGQKYGSDCDSLNQCRALGSERFKDEIEAALRRKIRAGKAGARARRPEKQS